MARGLARLALIGTWGGFAFAAVVIALFGPPLPVPNPRCAPAHAKSPEDYIGTVRCLVLTDKEFDEMLNRELAKDQAERKMRAAKEGPILAWLRGDD